MIWPILDRLDMADEPNDRWLGPPPIPCHLMSWLLVEEYKVGEGDLIRVSVFELVTPGSEYFKVYPGKRTWVILPCRIFNKSTWRTLPPHRSRKRSDRLSVEKGFLLAKGNGSPGPQVSVTLLQSRGRGCFRFSWGIRAARALITLLGLDFRLLDALALAHDISGGTQPGMDYLYVIRPAKGRRRDTGIDAAEWFNDRSEHAIRLGR